MSNQQTFVGLKNAEVFLISSRLTFRGNTVQNNMNEYLIHCKHSKRFWYKIFLRQCNTLGLQYKHMYSVHQYTVSLVNKYQHQSIISKTVVINPVGVGLSRCLTTALNILDDLPIFSFEDKKNESEFVGQSQIF